MNYQFDDVTLLITHYNRSQSLARLLDAFAQLHCSFAAIIVSDDNSRPEHQQVLEQLREKYDFLLVKAQQNGGLGNNINKGQDAVKTKYTLYIQEDFVPKPAFIEQFQRSLTFMDQDKALDLVRFYSYLPYPYLKFYEPGFSEVVMPRWGRNYKKIYAYSDHPHVRRSSFLTKFGRYVEYTNPDKTEYRMCVSFFQKKGKAVVFNEFKNLLSQENTVAEPSTVNRFWWHKQPQPILVKFLQDVYRQVKYNFDIEFM